MFSNYDSFVNYVGTKHPKGTNDLEGTNHQKGKIHPEDMKLLIKKVRILLLRLGIGYLINIACFLIVCFVNRKTKDEGEGGFLLFCSIVIFAVCFYAFITFALVYRISRFSKDADNSKAEYKVSKYQKFMMVYKCLDVIFDIAVLLYSFILSDWQLTAFTTTATAVLCTDIVLNIIVVKKNCCSDEEKSNTYRSSETNQAFEFREMKEDGSNYIHHGSDNREESLSREGERRFGKKPLNSISLNIIIITHIMDECPSPVKCVPPPMKRGRMSINWRRCIICQNITQETLSMTTDRGFTTLMNAEKNKCLVLVGAFSNPEIVRQLSNEHVIDLPDLFCSHKEADTRILLHVIHFDEIFQHLNIRGLIIVKCSNT
ncbi:Hypothetical predicted protein [Mytilus galloprovincialis]|uniref:Uncharacterized protein n=1 Tax=Mytilus galloprovincialis TaxID=29158 RepID=A0A8B6HBC6_MYTGA|nr:Hypothetical predicted protein [Mytilus galloprovincialis]